MVSILTLSTIRILELSRQYDIFRGGSRGGGVFFVSGINLNKKSHDRARQPVNGRNE
jgi:hypothetical protein